jgi:hypothetical protein
MSHAWENFYFMVGSAAAGLIGLLFVVETLTSSVDRSVSLKGAKLYLTPTVLHFSIVFTLSAVSVAPGLSAHVSAVLVGGAAVVGLLSAVRASIGLRRGIPGLTEAPHWSDFWLYGVAPSVFYLPLVAATIGIWLQASWAPFAAAGSLLAILLLGIRNAWDLVTWMAPTRTGR